MACISFCIVAQRAEAIMSNDMNVWFVFISMFRCSSASKHNRSKSQDIISSSISYFVRHVQYLQWSSLAGLNHRLMYAHPTIHVYHNKCLAPKWICQHPTFVEYSRSTPATLLASAVKTHSYRALHFMTSPSIPDIIKTTSAFALAVLKVLRGCSI